MWAKARSEAASLCSVSLLGDAWLDVQLVPFSLHVLDEPLIFSESRLKGWRVACRACGFRLECMSSKRAGSIR